MIMKCVNEIYIKCCCGFVGWPTHTIDFYFTTRKRFLSNLSLYIKTHQTRITLDTHSTLIKSPVLRCFAFLRYFLKFDRLLRKIYQLNTFSVRKPKLQEIADQQFVKVFGLIISFKREVYFILIMLPNFRTHTPEGLTALLQSIASNRRRCADATSDRRRRRRRRPPPQLRRQFVVK